MKFIWGSFVFLLTMRCSYAAMDNSGTEFILCYMDNTVTGDDTDLEMFITTSSNNVVYINVTAPLHDSSWAVNISVTRGNIVNVILPASLRGTGTGKDGLAVRVVATDAVTVYSVNAQLFSTDAFIAFPIDALGSEYIAVTWDSLSEMMVAAVADDTNVTFQFSHNYTAGNITYDGTTYQGGDSLTVSLQLYETFHVYSEWGDLTGTTISADKPFTAFSGNKKVPVMDTGTKTTSDHLVEQLIPVQAWGKEFVTFTTPERTLGEFLRITASEDGTLYRFNASTYLLNAAEYHTHNVLSGSYFYITSTKGICIAVIAKTIGDTWTDDGPNGGDPAMSFAVPVALYVSDYTFSTVQLATGSFTNYLVVVCHSNDTAGLVLDKAPAVGVWEPVTGSDVYVGAVFNVSDGAHSVYNTDPTKGFLGMAMGNAPFNSYAYASGMRLAPINLPCNRSSTTAGDGADNDCDGRIDEETDNGIDDDGDGEIDEDLALGARVDGQWGTWGNWPMCSITCGDSGLQSRERYCDSPAPANNGLACPGNSTESQSCTSNSPCPVNGDWGQWANQQSCSVTCGAGTRSRHRSCDSAPPQHGGDMCNGTGSEITTCGDHNDYCLPSFYGNTLWGCSAYTEFGCASGTIRCIDIAFRCDGTADCEDSSDESAVFTGCMFCRNSSSDLRSPVVSCVAAAVAATIVNVYLTISSAVTSL